MRALVRDEYGTPDVLRVVDVDDPQPGPGEAVVRVVASSINDWDYLLLTGRPWVNRVNAPRRPRQRVLGSDVAGVVEALGPDVTRLRVGDRVMADASSHGFGAFAERILLPESALQPVPADVPLDIAGTLPQAGGLALAALDWKGGVQPGERVLVNGAGGGVGTIAVQLAKAGGAHVTGADREPKLDTVIQCGADEVLDIAGEDISRRGVTFDRVVDVAMHRSWPAARRLLAPGGVYAVIGGGLGLILPLFAAGPVLSAVGDRSLGIPRWHPGDPAALRRLGMAAQAGTLTPVIDSTVALEEVADAFRRFGESRHVGKIAVRVSGDPGP